MKDEELERIKLRKLKEMMQNVQSPVSGSIAVARPINVTDSTFYEFIRKSLLVVIDCWAAWCAPCRMVAPIIEGMARDYSGRILFGKLDVDKNPEIAHRFQVKSIPTLLVFRNGRLINRIVGALPRHILETKISRYLH